MKPLQPNTPVDLSFLDTAPVSTSASVRIAATGSQVFDCFEDAAAWPKWAPAIRRVEWTSPPPYGVGTTRTVHMLGGAVGEEEFIAWDRGRHMAFCFTASNLPSESFAEEYVITERSGAGVDLTWRMAMTPTGPGAQMAGITGPVMGGALKLLLGRLRSLVESEYS